MQASNAGRSNVISIRPPIAPHLRGSAVLKMLQEEEGTNHIGSEGPNHIGSEGPVNFGAWPPQDHGQSNRPLGFMTKVTRGPGGRPVEWPPRPELTRSQEQLDQVPRHLSSDPAPPPVPPRPANYPQAKMDQVQVQQQQQHQQMTMQQQQQRQQVSSSVQMKTVKQVQQFQTYEQQFTSGGQGSVQYQLTPQQEQSLQYQMSQQTSNSQHVPAGMEYQVPIQQPLAPEHHGPKHGIPTPFLNQNSMAAPQSVNQNVPPSQFANQNAPPSHQFTNQNVAPPQHTHQNASVPPQNANQNGDPSQYAANQNADLPIYASGTTQDNPDGYTTAYTAIHGEWPPKQEDNPNLTTVYPSGFKLKDQPGFQSGPAKVVTSQPAFKITQPIRRSGDDKWPPRGAGEPTQEEVREFVKPKKSNKNYEEFFAQNALPHNYAGYRPPPGTQHHGLEEDDGVSNM